MKKNLILVISHNIYLKKEEVDLILNDNDIDIEITGVCVPIWHCLGDSSEPAREVFCKYYLNNKKENDPIEKLKNGFRINLPQLPEDYKESKPLTDSEWKSLSEKELSEWYEINKAPPNAKYLENDGHLCYMQYDKFMYKKQLTNIIHNVNIKPYKELINSLT
jgi:hypothetical protein